MKNTLAKVISALIITSMLLGFAALFQAKAYDTTKTIGAPLLFVEPASNIFTTPPMIVGSTFVVDVAIANFTNLAGIQFTLVWNPALLSCNSWTDKFFSDPLITKPADYPSNVNDLSGGIDNVAGNSTYAITWKNGGLAKSHGYDPANITEFGDAYGIPLYPWASGIHVAAEFNFTVLQQPNSTMTTLSCPFHLADDIIGDVNAIPIAHTNVDGLYENTFTITPPYFSMTTQGPGASGSTYTAHSVGEIFNVTVSINNVDPALQAIGYQFSLGYNSSLLNVLNVYQGPFLPLFGAPPDQGTSFFYGFGFNATLNQDFVGVGQIVLPDVNGTWHAPFPSGSGVLAIINFNCTLQNTFPAPDLTCPLTMFDTIVANNSAAVLPQSQPPNSGTYIMKALIPVVGRIIDVFTGWPAPYGGQGPNMPSDMFWPQKSVSLYANVTYNGWAEQEKNVAFEINAPNGQIWAIIYAETNASGIAYTNFRLPWPCDDPEQWFGVWTVTATVDIACNVVTDTVQFHYDYLAVIFKQTTDLTTYNHTDYVDVNVTYGTHLQQLNAIYYDEISNSTMNLSNVTVVVTAFDEVRVPYGYIGAQVPLTTANVQYGNASELVPFGGTGWCYYTNFTVSLRIYIPKFAVAGFSEIDCAILSGWPSLGGTVISGYYNTATSTWMPYDPTIIYINAA